jgi:mono/diheme cytochrome c family protein
MRMYSEKPMRESTQIMSGAMRIVLITSLAVLASASAQAQNGNARHGLAIALEACVGCHGVRKGETSSNTDAPAFDVIAAVPGMTALALQSMLQTSHRVMPNLILPATERADLIAYILSLNTH